MLVVQETQRIGARVNGIHAVEDGHMVTGVYVDSSTYLGGLFHFGIEAVDRIFAAGCLRLKVGWTHFVD